MKPSRIKFKAAGRKIRPARGEALVLTVLILAAILAIALAVSNVFVVEIRLAGDVGDSAKAIMAADSGLEWALYKERKILPGDPDPTFNNSSCHGNDCLLGVTAQCQPTNSCASFTITIDRSGKTVIRSIGTYHTTKRGLQVSF